MARAAATLAGTLLLLAPWTGRTLAEDWSPSPAGVTGAPGVRDALGAATVILPIEMPPGRQGLQPALALAYGSGAGTGNAGFGFSLELGEIARSTRLGPPRFDDTDTFVLTLEGQSYDLMPIDDASTRFRTVIDSGFLIERRRPGPFGPDSFYWTARGRDGRFYRFGALDDASGEGISQTADLHWGLDRVEDPSGNVMSIRWFPAAGRLYPVQVLYTSHPAGGLEAGNRVGFCWEERGDQSPRLWGERTVFRLASIATFAAGLTGRTWELDYATPPGTTRIGECITPPLPGGGDGDPGTGTTTGDPTPPLGSGRKPRRIQSASESASIGSDPRDGRAAPAAGADAIGDATLNEPRLTTSFAIPTTAPSTADSLLVRVRRGDGLGNYLPPLEYQYHADRSISWEAPFPGGALPLPVVDGTDTGDEDTGVRLQDLNRDGLPDLIQFSARVTTGIFTPAQAVYLNHGGVFIYDETWTRGLDNLIDPGDGTRSGFFVIKRGTRNRVDNGARFLDVNDDGFPDIVRIAGYFSYGLRKEVFLNTGSGFTSDRSALYPVPDEPFVHLREQDGEDIADDLGVRIADINADGRADILVSRAGWSGPAERRVYLHAGAGYRAAPGFVLPDEPFVRRLPGGPFLDMGVRPMELNGDGYVDLFVARNVDGTVTNRAYLHALRSDGGGPTWELQKDDWWLSVYGERFVDVSSRGVGASLDRGLRVGDIDRDGRSDILLARSWDGTTEKRLFTTRPDGPGWTARVLSAFPGLFIVKAAGQVAHDQGLRLHDIDGDGGLDVAFAPGSGTREWRRSAAWQHDILLSGFSNGLGGRTVLRWAPAPHDGFIEGGAAAALPFPLAVVAARSEEDGMGNAYTTTYGYAGGFYHHAAREFRGFHTVESREPGGRRLTISRFLQQPGSAVAPLAGTAESVVARRAADGAVFSRLTWTYDTGDARPPIAHPLLAARAEIFDWLTTDPDIGEAVLRTATFWSYGFDDSSYPFDRPMLWRLEHREGDPDDPGDDRFTREDFISALDATAGAGPSSGRWFVDRPHHRVVYGADGLVAQETWLSYDGGPPGTLGDRGLVTAEERRGGEPGPESAGARGRSVNRVVRRVYDAQGNMIAETDPLGRTRRIVFGLSDVSRTFPEGDIDPLGHAGTRRFDPRSGLIIESIDANGAAVRMDYDGFGRPLAEYGPYDSAERPTVAYRHDYTGVPARELRYARERSGLGETAGSDGCIESVAFFDGLGRLLQTRVEAAGGGMIARGARTFDAAGRVEAELRPFATAGPDYAPPPQDTPARHYAYDDEGRTTSVTEPDGAISRRLYQGSRVTFLDPMDHRVDRWHDAFGHVTQVSLYTSTPSGPPRPASVSRYAYDAAGRPVAVTDPSGLTTRIRYDTLGQRAAIDDPHIGSWAYAYDAAGNLVAETDPQGLVTRIAYDPLDRPIVRDYADGRRDAWRYDEGGAAAAANGRLTSILDPTGEQSFTHDLMGRVIEARRRLGGIDYVQRTVYDAQGRSLFLDLPDAVIVAYSYDEGGNLASIFPFVRRLDYDEEGRLVTTRLQNGVTVIRSYDPAGGRLKEIAAQNAASDPIYRLQYDHQPDGRITSSMEWLGGTTVHSWSYTYDDRHRLTRVTAPYGDLAYHYDDLNNLVVKEGVGFFYDDPAHPQRLTRTSSGAGLAYDAYGRVVTIGDGGALRAFSYDGAGRMSALSEATSGLRIVSDYDASGRRVREVVAQGGRSSILHVPFPQVEARDGRISLRIFAGPLLVAIVEPGGTTHYPIVDQMGTTRLILDGGGGIENRRDYLPFGEPIPIPGDDPQVDSHRFAGAESDPVSGLLLMGERHYDPRLGRFLQPDALIADRFDPLATHRYAYSRNDPVNLVDPDGRSPLAPILFIGALALLDRDTRSDAATSVALTAASIFLTGSLGTGVRAGLAALSASTPALYAAATTSVLLNSRLGEGIVSGYTELFRELGISPRGSAAAARIFSTLMFNSHLQRSFATAVATRGEAAPGRHIGNRGDLDRYLAAHGTSTEDLGTPSHLAYGTSITDVSDPAAGIHQVESVHELIDGSGAVIGVFGTRHLALTFQHGTVGFLPGGSNGLISGITSRAHYGYLIGGISTQHFARELFGAGLSGSLFTLTGKLSNFLIEFIYGPYGGGLALGVNAGVAAAPGGDPP